MRNLSLLTDQALFKIIKCKKLKALGWKPNEINELNQFIDGRLFNLPTKSQSLIFPITDAPGAPLLVVSVFQTLKSVSMGLIAGAATFITFISGSSFFWATYKDLNKDIEKDKQEILLSLLKIHAAAEIYERNFNAYRNIHLYPHRKAYTKIAKLKNYYVDIPQLKGHSQKIKSSIYSSLQVSGMLFGIYYFGITPLLVSLGVAALTLSNPITLGITLLSCIAIGTYFGFKNYQFAKRKEQIIKVNKNLNKELAGIYEDCAVLNKPKHCCTAKKEMFVETPALQLEAPRNYHPGLFTRNLVFPQQTNTLECHPITQSIQP